MQTYFMPSVETIPGVNAKVVFTPDTTTLFKESIDIPNLVINDKTSIVPWGADNLMPYDILNKIEADETLTTCQTFNAEVCYGGGINYCTRDASKQTKQEVEDFLFENNMADYFLGACLDFKHFGFCVSLLILSKDGTRITNIIRKEAADCRFTPADGHGVSKEVLFANWESTDLSQIEHMPLLSLINPWRDLQSRMQNGDKHRKFAVVSRIPTARNTYYPIPYYASIFKSRWYDIKQLITTAKKAKLENSAPIKYQIEISARYWEKLFISKGITSIEDKRAAVNESKQQMIDFLTRAENSGKVLFSEFYQTPDGKEQQEVRITTIATGKEGGDWETDIQEAINIMCFTLRVHSNLVGSVPGKAQTNNSGSDKRELYTIAQALQKPYHDILFMPHRIIIRYNGWDGVHVDCPFIQLTTLDEHRDAKLVTTNQDNNDTDNQ